MFEGIKDPDYRVDIVVNQALKDLVKSKGAWGNRLTVLPSVCVHVFEYLDDEFETEFNETKEGAFILLKKVQDQDMSKESLQTFLKSNFHGIYEGIDFVITDLSEDYNGGKTK